MHFFKFYRLIFTQITFICISLDSSLNSLQNFFWVQLYTTKRSTAGHKSWSDQRINSTDQEQFSSICGRNFDLTALDLKVKLYNRLRAIDRLRLREHVRTSSGVIAVIDLIQFSILLKLNELIFFRILLFLITNLILNLNSIQLHIIFF